MPDPNGVARFGITGGPKQCGPQRNAEGIGAD
jgi:hypothetical protein